MWTIPDLLHIMLGSCKLFPQVYHHPRYSSAIFLLHFLHSECMCRHLYCWWPDFDSYEEEEKFILLYVVLYSNMIIYIKQNYSFGDWPFFVNSRLIIIFVTKQLYINFCNPFKVDRLKLTSFLNELEYLFEPGIKLLELY